MQTFRPNEGELAPLTAAARALRLANEALGKAKKDADAAKNTITTWLREKRNVDVATLSTGDQVNIEGIVLIEIGKARKFDERGFLAAEPSMHAAWLKNFPVTKFKPLA